MDQNIQKILEIKNKKIEFYAKSNRIVNKNK